MACDKDELSVLFADDSMIADLNSRYLGRLGPTNVLAFPMSEDQGRGVASGMLGDVAISVDTAVRESEESGERLEETVCRLLIHGILHLMGYNHETVREERIMRKEEKRLFSLVREG
ncbi:MAG TPA: rRNA maturation RNase YbeY [Desulfatiglandales bacterium]|nr:rRNA maturation RNase YbeY [Desulfatiglandales bacterium]